MRWLNRALLTAVGCGFGGTALADTGVEPAAFPPRKTVPCPTCPPAGPVCPPLVVPGSPVAPGMPGQPMMLPPGQLGQPMMPPAQPGQPGQPAAPDQSMPPGQTPPPAAPNTAAGPTPGGAGDLLASASAAGTGAGAGLLPTVNGDLLGGGGIAGPLIVTVAPDGRIVGRQPVIVLPDGRRVTLSSNVQRPVDELLRNRTPLQVAPPGSRTTALFPEPGTVFDESLADAVARTPQIVRGPFKVTENDSPRPRDRFYASFYFYDQVFKGFGGPTPRVRVYQQVLGVEKAFASESASVGLRLPYNQLVATGLYSDTGLGDLTLTSKVILLENTESGNLLSAGLLLTVPTGERPFRSTITGSSIGGTLVQPYLGYIYRFGDAYAQGFTSLVIPTDNKDVTLFASDVQFGYYAYRNEGGRVSGIIPTAEIHVTTPLDHRGARNEPVGFVDQVTILGGVQTLFNNDRAALGLSIGAPITGPRPFSLQATVQFNLWF